MNKAMGHLLLLAVLTGCSGSQDRFEDITKFRAFGVATAPVVGEPSTAQAPQTLTLTFYAALPLGQTVDTVEPFLDPSSAFAPPSLVAIVPKSGAYEEHTAFHIYSVQATLPVPTAAELQIPADPGFARLRYAVRLISGGSVQEVVGNALVYPSGTPQLKWTAPTIDITAPLAGAAVSGTADLKAALSSANGENLRVGWYANNGDIKNRGASETSWKVPNVGANTILLTVRGFSSGAFAYKVVDVVGH